MVEIIPESMSVYAESILPAVRFKAKHAVDAGTIVQRIDGSVFSEDNKFIASLIPLTSVPEEKRVKIKIVSEEMPTTKIDHEFELMFFARPKDNRLPRGLAE